MCVSWCFACLSIDTCSKAPPSGGDGRRASARSQLPTLTTPDMFTTVLSTHPIISSARCPIQTASTCQPVLDLKVVDFQETESETDGLFPGALANCRRIFLSLMAPCPRACDPHSSRYHTHSVSKFSRCPGRLPQCRPSVQGTSQSLPC